MKSPDRRRPARAAGGALRSRRWSAASDGGLDESGNGCLWLYGRHAALAAAANPDRRIRRMLALPDLAAMLVAAAARAGTRRPEIEVTDRAGFAAVLPAGAVHQGVAVLSGPLAARDLDELVAGLEPVADAVVVVLDQVVDPRNVGAIVRSAAAFAASAVIVQDRHAPAESGTLAKAASGALETVPLVTVVNIARALRTLRDHGFLCLGLDASAEASLAEAGLGGGEAGGRLALVIGGEGAGLRRLVRENCDALARIPIAPAAGSLNVAVAAGIALCAASRLRRDRKERHDREGAGR